MEGEWEGERRRKRPLFPWFTPASWGLGFAPNSSGLGNKQNAKDLGKHFPPPLVPRNPPIIQMSFPVSASQAAHGWISKYISGEKQEQSLPAFFSVSSAAGFSLVPQSHTKEGADSTRLSPRAPQGQGVSLHVSSFSLSPVRDLPLRLRQDANLDWMLKLCLPKKCPG